MSLYHEVWRQEGKVYPHAAYYSRQNLHLRDLPENHLKRAKEVPFEFHEYRVIINRFRPTTNSLVYPTSAL